MRRWCEPPQLRVWPMVSVALNRSICDPYLSQILETRHFKIPNGKLNYELRHWTQWTTFWLSTSQGSELWLFLYKCVARVCWIFNEKLIGQTLRNSPFCLLLFGWMVKKLSRMENFPLFIHFLNKFSNFRLTHRPHMTATTCNTKQKTSKELYK